MTNLKVLNTRKVRASEHHQNVFKANKNADFPETRHVRHFCGRWRRIFGIFGRSRHISGRSPISTRSEFFMFLFFFAFGVLSGMKCNKPSLECVGPASRTSSPSAY